MEANPEKIVNVFQEAEGRIAIFHYAGHSNQDSIFNGSAYGPTKAKNLADYLAHQQGLELIFLNACLNQQQAALYQATGAKAVIATNREIPDEGARVVASEFFRLMALDKSITQAFKELPSILGLKNQGASRSYNFDFKIVDGNLVIVENDFSWELFPETGNDWKVPPLLMSIAFEKLGKYLAVIPAKPPEAFKGREKLG